MKNSTDSKEGIIVNFTRELKGIPELRVLAMTSSIGTYVIMMESGVISPCLLPNTSCK
jgi:hypothetical protein